MTARDVDVPLLAFLRRGCETGREYENNANFALFVVKPLKNAERNVVITDIN